jgi:hypothetical protein
MTFLFISVDAGRFALMTGHLIGVLPLTSRSKSEMETGNGSHLHRRNKFMKTIPMDVVNVILIHRRTTTSR